MTSEQFQMEERLFTEALALPPTERRGFIQINCARDSELRDRLEDLLRASEQGAGFLEMAPEWEVDSGAREARVAFATGDLGSTIGHYRLVEKIGEGGCGVVYLAEQEKPVRRNVALKVIKLGMDTMSVIARFEAERQALALMDHPNIARVFDAGATATGRPFFVMELVPGIRITDYCDQHRLKVAERLGLFVQVCRAVEHAHQKGVIHRDLKPSNILVTAPEGGPLPKVIDFGIAKATQGRLTDLTVVTVFDQFMGTPAYMSPEQVEFSGLDVDTRTDVYSLGVLLYELLTGRTPLDPADLLQSGSDQVRRQITQAEVERPSARLQRLDRPALGLIAEARQVAPGRLGPLVTGDLDWIVMRCLEKERSRRYETVNSLARDIERYLANEPVEARPPSAAYTLWKFIRRHRTGFAAGGAVAVALLAGIIVSTTLFFREKAARERAVGAERQQAALRQQAEGERRKAETEAARSKQTARFMEDMLRGVGPAVAQGRDTTLLREILDGTERRLDKELKDQPRLQTDLRNTLGQVYSALGEQSHAESTQRTVLATERQLDGGETLAEAAALNQLGETLRLIGKPAEAEQRHRAALDIQQKLLEPNSMEIAQTDYYLGEAILAESVAPINRKPEAERFARAALAIQEENLDAPMPATQAFLGEILKSEHNYVESEEVLREARSAEPDNPDVLHQLADVLPFTGKLPEAEEVLGQALALKQKTLNTDNPELTAIQSQLADYFTHDGKATQAEPILRTVVNRWRRLLEREPTNPNFMRELSKALDHLGSALFQEGKYTQAEPIDREALALHEIALGNVNSEGVDFLHRVADDLWAENRLNEAETAFRNLLAVEEKTADQRINDSIERLLEILKCEHKPTSTDPFWTAAIAVAQDCTNHSAPNASAFTAAVAMELLANGKSRVAEPLIRINLAKIEKTNPSSWYVPTYRYLLGGVLADQGEFSAAESLLLTSFAQLEQREGVDVPLRGNRHIYYAAIFIAKMYRDWGKPEQAAAWDKKSLEVKSSRALRENAAI